MRNSLLLLFVSVIALAAIAGCGSNSAPTSATQSASGAAADFSLSATPASATLSGGSSGQSLSVTASAANGFAASVAVSLSGLPTGVTATPATLALSPGTPQTIMLSADTSVSTSATTLTLTGISGSLSHSAKVALTTTAAGSPPSAADFSLTVSPTSLTIAQGSTGSAISVTATGAAGFSGPVSTSITGLPAGVTASPATLTLTPGAAQSITLTAAASTATGASTVSFIGTAATLSHAAGLALTVQAAPGVSPPAVTSPDVTTYHYDNARDGLNAQETILKPTNVTSATFGKVGFFSSDGLVDAQPLYLSGLNISGTATNVLYTASEHDSVYAFNADTGAQIWKVSLLGKGETPSDPRSCDQVVPEIGITSTPVIDRAKTTVYVVAMSKDASGGYHQRLHALNLTTGAELPGSPREITGSYPGTGDNSKGGTVIFAPSQYEERAALLLLNGQIFLTWTSHCDIRPYTGWVMAYDENTLQQTAILNLTPNGNEGSVWMSGNGMAADASGNIYFLDANGTLDTGFDANGFPSQHDYGNAIVKLSTANGALAVADYFEPYNTVSESNADVDLGSGGVMLLPDQTDSAGNVHHLLVGAGKDAHIYVANRDSLGKFNQSAKDNSNIYQDLPNALAKGAWSSPAYFNGTVYYAGQGDVLKAFPISNARLATSPSSQSSQVYGYPGSTPSISANGTQNGIVWALQSTPGATAALHAYDASSMNKELYNSRQAANGRDSFGNGNKFITPVIVNGKVFVGTPTGVVEFGLFP